MRLTLRIEPPPLAEAIRRLGEAIRQRGGRAVLVGGCVRDMLRAQPAKDVDVEVYGLPPTDLKNLIAGMYPLDLVGQSFGVIKVRGWPIDISIPRRERCSGTGHRDFVIDADPFLEPRAAAERRDFTVNAMSCDALQGELFDPFGGVADLERGILRHVSPRFAEDPLRVLRGMQFAARFELCAAAETLRICRSLTPDHLALERVGEEWEKLTLRGVRPSLGLTFLRDCGWLTYYPELAALVGCPQDPQWHPEGDVWTHTLKCMDAFARARVGDGEEDWIVGMATLCHDLGKPSTTAERDGRLRSPGHDVAGVDLARRFLTRITRRNARIEAVLTLVRTHMRPTDFFRHRAGDAAIRRLAAQVGRLDRLVRVAAADLRGTAGCEFSDDPAGRWLMQRAEQLQVKDEKPRPIVRGRTLQSCGLTPGPQFGPILRDCYEAQLEGLIRDETEGVAWLRARGLI
jgi:tRNA nucleotidyltransferase (CCA-adding enzyme)